MSQTKTVPQMISAGECENPYKGFMQDFRIADRFGKNAIKDTYNRAFKEWKDDVDYFASLVCTLNHLIWYHHDKGNDEIARIYNDLWRKADNYALDHFKGEDLSYYVHFLD